MRKKVRQFKERFYEGPDWINMRPFLPFPSYRSFTFLSAAWLYAYYMRFFTVLGRMILPVSFLIISYSLTPALQTPTRIFAFALLSIFITDFTLGFIFRPRFRIRREIPSKAGAGNPIKVNYFITNCRKLPAWNILLDSIQFQTGLKFQSEPASIDCVPARKETFTSTYLYAEQRGKYCLPSPMADSAFPFCIFKWSCRSMPSQNLLVHPKYEPLNTITLPVGRRYQRYGTYMVSKVGESMDFLGCREFRTGDNPKHIHWPSTARAQEFIIREFQEEYLYRIALIVDTYVPLKRFSLFPLMKKKNPFRIRSRGISFRFSSRLFHQRRFRC